MSQQLSRAVQLSVFHGAVALVLGVAIEVIMPRATVADDIPNLAFETALQLGLNGAAVGLASRYVAADDDPTAGIPFGCALLAAQPGLEARLTALSERMRSTLKDTAQGRAPPS